MLPITVVIPVKNEEKNIADCLETLRSFEDVIVVDSGSTDKTVKIVTENKIKLIEFIWDGKFPKKRNWVLKNYNFITDWVLFLDADELLTEEFIEEVENKIEDTDVDGYWLTYQDYFLGKYLKHGVPMRKLALFRVGKGEYERIDEENWSKLDMEIHEHPIIEGEVGVVKAPILHHDNKPLKRYIERHNEYSSWEANRYISLFDSDKKVWERFTSRQRKKYQYIAKWWWSPLYFIYSYFFKFGFLDGREGLIFAIMKCNYFFQIYCKIQEKLKSQK